MASGDPRVTYLEALAAASLDVDKALLRGLFADQTACTDLHKFLDGGNSACLDLRCGHFGPGRATVDHLRCRAGASALLICLHKIQSVQHLHDACLFQQITLIRIRLGERASPKPSHLAAFSKQGFEECHSTAMCTPASSCRRPACISTRALQRPAGPCRARSARAAAKTGRATT